MAAGTAEDVGGVDGNHIPFTSLIGISLLLGGETTVATLREPGAARIIYVGHDRPNQRVRDMSASSSFSVQSTIKMPHNGGRGDAVQNDGGENNETYRDP